MRLLITRLVTLAVLSFVLSGGERLHAQSTLNIIGLSGGPVNVGASTRLAEHGGDRLVIDFSGVISIFPLGLPSVTLVVNGQELQCSSPVFNGHTQMQCDTPAGTPGAQATVVVAFSGGQSAEAELEYWAPSPAALVLRAQCAGPDPSHPLKWTVVFEYTNNTTSDVLVTGPANVLTVNGVVDSNTLPVSTFLAGTHTAFVYQYPAGATVAWTVIDPLSSLTRTAAAGWWTPACPGAPGPQGPAGPQGPQGPAGPAGTNGADGAVGPQGPAGANGVDGAVGPQGPAGPAGANGVDGAVGPQGPAGPAGANGNDGAIGPQGPAGTSGADGAVGSQGQAGANGVDGAVGPQGPAGPAGANGTDGAIGPQGPAGANGADGAVGPQGLAGPAGANGTDGAVGPVGPSGAAGAIGPQGPSGAMGLAGPMGPAGPQGPAGGAADLVSGTLLMLPAGVAPPANYTRVGSYTQDVDTGGSGRQKKLKLTIVIFRKQ